MVSKALSSKLHTSVHVLVSDMRHVYQRHHPIGWEVASRKRFSSWRTSTSINLGRPNSTLCWIYILRRSAACHTLRSVSVQPHKPASKVVDLCVLYCLFQAIITFDSSLPFGGKYDATNAYLFFNRLKNSVQKVSITGEVIGIDEAKVKWKTSIRPL